MISRRNFLKTSALASLALMTGKSALAQVSNAYCPVLMYHYVSYPPEGADRVLTDLIVTPELFTEHLTYLRDEGFTSISLAQLWAGLLSGAPLPPKPIVLTFDDGYVDSYAHATPILAQFGMIGTFFIVANFMDQPGYLTWGQAAEMKNAGMEIGNHSVSHPRLSGQSVEFQRTEIEGAAARIGEALGARPQFFCYPLGRYDNNTMRLVQESGHIAALTTSDGTVHWASNPYRMRRVRIRNRTNVNSLAWLVNRRV